MKKTTTVLLLLAFLAGCVEFADEKPVAESIYEPEPAQIVSQPVAAPEPKPVVNKTVLNPLAPLPEQNKSTVAVRPKSVPANSTTQAVKSGWTTEPVSIAEGETKYVYIKQ
ncbi:MAG: hypothetical protein QXT19_01350 [Candidatus Woesearchaeota archaeon]